MAKEYKDKKGATGKKYTTVGDVIKVTYTDGSTRVVRPTDKTYAATKRDMEKDITSKKWYRPAGNSKTTAETAVGKGVTDGIITTAEKVKQNEQYSKTMQQRRGLVKNDNIIDAVAHGGETGLNTAVSGIKSGAVGVAQTAADVVGADKTADALERTLRQMALDSAARQQAINAKYNTNFSGIAKGVSDVTAGAVGMIPTIASFALTPQGKLAALGKAGQFGAKALGFAPLALQAGGGGMNQALNEGADLDAAKQYGALTAAKEIATELPFAGIKYVPGVKNVGELVAEKLANQTAKKVAAAAANMAGEGAEEALSEIVDPLLQRATYNEDAENASVKDVAYAALLGGLTAGALNAGIKGAETVPNVVKNLPNAQKVMQNDQNRAFEALHGQKIRKNQAIPAQTSQNGVKQEIVNRTIENIIKPQNVAQNQSSQADFQPDGMQEEQGTVRNSRTVEPEPAVEESSNVIVKNVPSESDMPRIQIEYQNSTDTNMLGFIDRARKMKTDVEYYHLDRVTAEEAKDIFKLTGIDTSGFKRSIPSHAIQHIDKDHGIHGRADQTMADENDIARMEYVIKNYDSIEFAGMNDGWETDKNNNPIPLVKYAKRVNGMYYVVETVPDTKRKTLVIKSAYKNAKKESTGVPPGSWETQPDPGTDATKEAPYRLDAMPQANVQNDRTATSFVDNIIPENQQEYNDNSASQSNRKVSQLYTNTMQKTPLFTEAERNLFEASEYEYDVVSEKESLQRAAERLESDYEGAKKELQGKDMLTGDDVDVAMFFVQEGLESGRETGDYSQAKAWVKKIQESATVEGRAVQALAKYSRTTAEGIMVQAQKYAKQSEEALKTDKVLGKEKDSAKWRKVEAETEQVTKAIEEAEAKAQQSAEEKLSEMLAARAESMVKGSGRERELTDKQIVNELYNVLTETGIPDNRPKGKTDVYKYLRHAVENKDRYTEVWESAQELLKNKYSADTELDTFMRDSLDKFFSSGIIPTYSKKTTTAATKQSAKELGIDLREIIKENDGDKGQAMTQIADRVVKMSGFAQEDARLLTNEVMSAYTSTLREYTEKRLKQLFPEIATNHGRKKSGQQSGFDKVMELINLGAYSRQDIVDVIKQRNNLPVLTNADIKTIQENVEAANQYERYSYEWKKYMAKAQQVAADKMPQTTKNKVTQLKRLMMLSNPRTDVRNIAGNVPLAGTEIASDFIGALADKGLSKVRGTNRTTTVNPHLVEFMKGFGRGWQDTVKDIRNNVNTYRMGEESTTQYEMPRSRTFQNTTGGIRGGINDFLNGIDKIVNYGLMFGDRPFFEAHYAKRMAQLKQLGYDAEAPETKADAYAYAVDMVFQSNSDMAKGASGIREALNNLCTINGFALGDFVIPFVQTPANIADKLLDYSPVGFVKAMGQAYNSGIKKTAPFDQRLFCQNVGRSLTGMAILGVGYTLAKAGIITGSSDDDAEKRNAMTVAGWKPYSFYIDGKYYDYSYIQPVGMLLAMAADAYQEGQSVEDLTDIVAAAGAGIKGGVDCFFNMSFFSSLTNFFGGYGSPAENMGSAFMDFPTQLSPAIVNAINKSIDPYQRETYDSDPLKRTINKFIAKTPASQTLPIKLDVYGNEMMQNQGREVIKRTIENMLIPSTVSERTANALNDELLRLNKDTGSKAQFLSYPDKKQDLGISGEYKLNGEEYNAFIENANGYAREQMNKLIQDDYYKGLSDEEKIEVLGQIEEIGKYKAKQELAKAHGTSYSTDEMENKLELLKECGNDYAKYHAIQNDFSGDKLETKVKKMEACDRFNMDYATYDEVTGILADLHDSTDANGKTIKGKARKDKVYAALVEQRNSGKITDEQMWYIWVDSYNANTRDKKSSLPYWKDCPYQWIVDAKVAEKEAAAEAKKNRQ